MLFKCRITQLGFAWPTSFQRDRAARFAVGWVGPTACSLRNNKKGQGLGDAGKQLSQKCTPMLDVLFLLSLFGACLTLQGPNEVVLFR